MRGSGLSAARLSPQVTARIGGIRPVASRIARVGVVDERAVEVEDQPRAERSAHAAFHLIEQPMDGVCSRGPAPVSATSRIAS